MDNLEKSVRNWQPPPEKAPWEYFTRKEWPSKASFPSMRLLLPDGSGPQSIPQTEGQGRVSKPPQNRMSVRFLSPGSLEGGSPAGAGKTGPARGRRIAKESKRKRAGDFFTRPFY